MKYDYPDEYYVSVTLEKPILFKKKEGVDQASIDIVEVIPIQDLYESHYLEIVSSIKDKDDEHRDHKATSRIIKSTIRDARTGNALSPFALDRLSLRHITQISKVIADDIEDPNE